jgi:hypothetical protein
MTTSATSAARATWSGGAWATVTRIGRASGAVKNGASQSSRGLRAAGCGLARLVEHFTARPQVEERLTQQIADWLDRELDAGGSAVVLDADHTRMTMRGVQAVGARTVISALRGLLRDSPSSPGGVLRPDRRPPLMGGLLTRAPRRQRRR